MAQRQYLTCFMILFQHSVLPPPLFLRKRSIFTAHWCLSIVPMSMKNKKGVGEKEKLSSFTSQHVYRLSEQHQEQQLQPSGTYFSVLGIKARLSHIQAVRLHWDPFQSSSSLCFRVLLLFLKEGDAFGHENITRSKENTYSVNSLTFFAA